MFKCSGHTGHGSILWQNTAGEKLSYITQKLYEFRKAEQGKLENNPDLDEGEVNCVNLTILNGGVLMNVIPVSFSATFDMRFVPDFDLKAFEKQVRVFGRIHSKLLQIFTNELNLTHTVEYLVRRGRRWYRNRVFVQR